MADLHESLLVAFRKAIRRKHFVLIKSPMPTYRPDILAERAVNDTKVQIVVEAEIASTLFLEHTAEQLVIMDEFIAHQEAKGITVNAYLLVPSGREVLSQANGLLEALFPLEPKIKACQRYQK